ncbi:MAG: Competence/damage-inducible domain protein CinA [Candidatus Gottesmanbacteria bacterium GW2011_GWA1_42_26]|nr:MAG: Competence/damage-inducible domain protein CinA [Candidatus Gottesmanbacteria bacterium GW2011_GWA1_42_26]
MTRQESKDIAPTHDQNRALQVGLETERNLILAERVVSELRSKKLYISTMESCTGGALAYYITNIPGASEVLKDAFVTYANEAKVKLGVPGDVIEKYSVYSRETAIAMAETVLKSSLRADVGVGITGSISRVDPNNPNSKPGEIFLAVKYQDRVLDKKLTIDAERRFDVKQQVVGEALSTILEIISK